MSRPGISEELLEVGDYVRCDNPELELLGVYKIIVLNATARLIQLAHVTPEAEVVIHGWFLMQDFTKHTWPKSYACPPSYTEIAREGEKHKEKQRMEEEEILKDYVNRNYDPGGVKHDTGKPRVSLIPAIAILRLAEVMDYGAVKYGDHNFRKGMKWSRVLDALFRHAFKIASGEHTDSESGLPHYAHILANAAMLGYYYETNKGTNDIPKEE